MKAPNILQVESVLWVLLILGAFVVSGSALLLACGLSSGCLLAHGAYADSSKTPVWFANVFDRLFGGVLV